MPVASSMTTTPKAATGIENMMMNGSRRDSYCEAITEAAARQGAAIIKTKAKKFNVSGRGKGAAGASVASVSYRVADMQAVVTGTSKKGEVWWPWLEGTSKRNRSTRFKGYHTFFRTRLRLARELQALIAPQLAAYLRKMGGA